MRGTRADARAKLDELRQTHALVRPGTTVPTIDGYFASWLARSPGQIVAVLLDEGRYVCSESTMYRLLREHGELRERRRQRRHPEYRKPELLATAPNQCWSWDITKLRGPTRGEWYALLVMLDIYSRMVVGWMLVRRAKASIAKAFIEQTIEDHHIVPGTLAIHADRGTEMTARPVCELLERLAVGRSHSRPHVSDDNPYSESQYKTMKYASDFPDRFGSFEHARGHTETFMTYYNTEHRHSGISMLTPTDVRFNNGEASSHPSEHGYDTWVTSYTIRAGQTLSSCCFWLGLAFTK